MFYLENIKKNFNGKSILTDINLAFDRGEMIILIGNSGVGKTTLLKILAGEIMPDFGRVILASKDVSTLKKKEKIIFRRKIGIIYQDSLLLGDKNVFENISFAMEVCGIDDKTINEDVPHILKLVNLGKKAFSFPEELSGGEKQRVSIARALINYPDIILADEPTANLDSENKKQIANIFNEIHATSKKILIITTHDGEFIKLLNANLKLEIKDTFIKKI